MACVVLTKARQSMMWKPRLCHHTPSHFGTGDDLIEIRRIVGNRSSHVVRDSQRSSCCSYGQQLVGSSVSCARLGRQPADDDPHVSHNNLDDTDVSSHLSVEASQRKRFLARHTCGRECHVDAGSDDVGGLHDAHGAAGAEINGQRRGQSFQDIHSLAPHIGGPAASSDAREYTRLGEGRVIEDARLGLARPPGALPKVWEGVASPSPPADCRPGRARSSVR